MARKPVYERMSTRELFDRMNAGDKAAEEYYGHWLDEEAALFKANNEAYEATHDMKKEREIMNPLLKDLFTLNHDDDDYYDLLRGIFAAIDAYYKAHGSTIDIITSKTGDTPDNRKFRAFCRALTPVDFEKGLGRVLTEEEIAIFRQDKYAFVLGLNVADCMKLFEYKRPTVSVTTKNPRDYFFMTDKMTRTVFAPDNSDLYGEKKQPVNVAKKGAEIPVTNYVALKYTDLEKTGKFQFLNKLNAFDKSVLNGVFTVYNAGNQYMSIAMIYQAMMKNPAARIKPAMQEAISNSIMKMMSTLIFMDTTAEAEAYGFKFKKRTSKRNLIMAEMETVSLNNNTVVDVIHIVKPSILWEYASTTNRVARFPQGVYDFPLPKNMDTIILADYLYQRITAMISNQNLTRRILFDSILNEILSVDEGAISPGARRKKKFDIRRKVATILLDWQQKGIILGFNEIKGEETNGKAQRDEVYALDIELSKVLEGVTDNGTELPEQEQNSNALQN